VSFFRRLAVSISVLWLLGCEPQDNPLPGIVDEQGEPIFTELFADGLAQWMSVSGGSVGGEWQFDDGVVMLSAAGGGDILTRRLYEDFELQIEWKISEGGNSGIFYGVAPDGQAVWTSGPEFQILDDVAFPDLAGSTETTGAVFGLYAPEKASPLPAATGFNSTKIIVRAGQVEHWLNGAKVAEFNMALNDWSERIAGSKFAPYPSFGQISDGHIALQDHGNQVWYRNARIREL
jgi:hypothetical protein